MRKVSLALVLMSLAGVAAAHGQQGQCNHFFGFDFCSPGDHYQPSPVTAAPEIDPASAVAGLTLLAGGLAVLRGRRVRISKE
jgi:hypothetical protein